ncbi:S adenosylmethionine dependent methyltransferase [Mycena sanguinolenta]|uniref:S adenosylmethionine dependent methyltransferase n=1 Tax=Mycena sanguinolenta TaxID=230812 RepID=A0A8H6XY93_9AGAR|nr:S adenosylmethionine dependent methyltransferase [Mycena sanguinolenta]
MATSALEPSVLLSSSSSESATNTKVTLRAPLPGDFGHIISRHGALYASEFNYPTRFEALVARICADFIENQDPAKERLWIAEELGSGTFLGCVMLVRYKPEPEDASDTVNSERERETASAADSTAKLRILLVEPAARGMGVGKQLVGACVDFARKVGYKRVVLWTQSSLLAARRLYKAAGFELIKSEEHESFGVKLVGEFWELRFPDS